MSLGQSKWLLAEALTIGGRVGHASLRVWLAKKEFKRSVVKMRWMRSEPMEYVSMILSEDSAHATVSALGNLGVVEFTDVRYLLSDGTCPPPAPFTAQSRRC